MDKFDRAQIKRWFLILSAIILTLIVVWTTTYKTPAALSFFKSRRQFDVSTSYSRSKEGECNYGVGRWVPDNKTRPIYSGVQCKRWLSSLTNCRSMPRRIDFSYEGFRWQPENCSIPEFNHQVFLNRHARIF
ncbi:hypothetical protein ZOSMA_394G00050 [Zostera marina]|uniref:Trichome birefringence-like N-terminal domain-containing protein n=1 Tax=Zostera marina TaxID=29655 RepID=A0A0K9P6H5_ZOSMR|nr:hypothetical protein ZOSMA_394G00050 [Zostera marina]